MSLQMKWHLREALRGILSIPFMTTMLLLVVIASRMAQFHTMGLSMYPGLEIPKHWTLEWALDAFWQLSLAPLLPYFLITIPLDALIRRYVLQLNQT